VAHKYTLFYGILGPRWGNFATSTSSFFESDTGIPVIANPYGKTSGYKVGFTAGLGMQQMLSDHLQISFEYAYTNYGNINTPNVVGLAYMAGTPTGETVTNLTTIKSHANTGLFAISYQW
jgi:opacity protein-like surface antigen